MQPMENDKKVLFKLTNLKQYFPLKKRFGHPQEYVKANDGLTFEIYEGETFGLVGESGCGKSTLGRVLLQLYKQTAGKSMYYGVTLEELAPMYVKELLMRADRRRQEAKDLQETYQALDAEYQALNDTDKMHKHGEVVAAQRAALVAELDLVQILGGFIVLEDMKPATALMLRDWEFGRAINKISEEENEYRIQANAYSARGELRKEEDRSFKRQENRAARLEKKADASAKKIESLRSQRVKVQEEIDALRQQYMSRPDFQKQEQRRDLGIDLAKLDYDEMRLLRKDVQLIFQDPYSSLNPRMTVGQIISEGLKTHKVFANNDPDMQEYVLDVMDSCGLAPYFLHRYPHQFSGGQRQRIGIARSLALKPKFVVADEAVSALDVSIQSQIINLLKDMKEKENYTYFFISHNLSVVKYISDRIGVMYLGNMVELASSQSIFESPLHPYTQALLSAIPTTDLDDDREMILLDGDIPSPVNPPPGCKFNTRCQYCTEICEIQTPEMEEVFPKHYVACHHWEEIQKKYQRLYSHSLVDEATKTEEE